MSNTKHWTDFSKQVLEGRTITKVRYLTDREMELMGWQSRPICFLLDNGTLCIPSMDDEGNDGGSLFFQSQGKMDCIPVI